MKLQQQMEGLCPAPSLSGGNAPRLWLCKQSLLGLWALLSLGGSEAPALLIFLPGPLQGSDTGSPFPGLRGGGSFERIRDRCCTREGADVDLAKERNRIYGNRWLAPQPEQ